MVTSGRNCRTFSTSAKLWQQELRVLASGATFFRVQDADIGEIISPCSIEKSEYELLNFCQEHKIAL